MPAKSLAQRQADLRQRRADEGLTEVRGLYAKPELHSKIKGFAKTLQKKKTPAEKPLDVTRNARYNQGIEPG